MGLVVLKLRYLPIFWVISVVVFWISLSYILALFAIIALAFELIVYANLTNPIVIFSCLILGTIATIGFYYVRSVKWNEPENQA